MIRNAVLHINNEQPMLADLLVMPSPSDVTLLCTNLRTLNGKRPVFADHVESVFVFPLIHLRFVEIPPGTMDDIAGAPPALPAGAEPSAEPDPELEIDEELLRRVREA